MPPMAGLHDICAIRSRFMVTMAVFRPMRAQARAASHPACPAPTTTTSYFSCIDIIVSNGYIWPCKRRAPMERGGAEMKILIIGSGGREHALAWKLARTPGVQIFGSPGNPGIAQIGTCIPARGGTPADYLAIAAAAHADLTVVGPEAPLVDGVVDAFRAVSRPIVGPTRDAARLEGSKVFAKDFLTQRGIPT